MIHAIKQEDQLLIQSVFDHKQEHIFRWWPELENESRQNLLAQIREIDFDQISHFQELLKNQSFVAKHDFFMEPPEVIHLPQTEGDKAKHHEARLVGEKMLSEGRVGTFMVAGGQGTRLGFEGPKGSYPICRMSGKSIFQIFAEKILAESRFYNVSVPWYIMTSETNDEATRAFFESNNYFGLISEDVYFVQQRMIPGLDSAGKLMLDAKDHLFKSPNGHGGSFLAMAEGGILKDCQKRGVELLSYFHVDNILIRPFDPVFIGFHKQSGSQMSSKMVQKRDAGEKVGVFGVVDGALCVVEYSDMSPEDMTATTPDGHLKYEAGSIGIHLFDTRFVAKMVEAGRKLPYHLAFKKIPFLSEEGQLINPEESNGYKFETFVFDAIRKAETSIILELKREEEFSPVKNRYGEDSPETARRDMSNYYADWLEAAGYDIPRDQDGNVPGVLEISPLYARNKEVFLANHPKDLKFNPVLLL